MRRDVRSIGMERSHAVTDLVRFRVAARDPAGCSRTRSRFAHRGSGAACPPRKASRRAPQNNRGGLRPVGWRAASGSWTKPTLAHAGHMKFEKLREDSRNRPRQCCRTTLRKSTGLADSWRVGEDRGCPAASLPRRRSPVRTRCSAPNRPDSACLADPGFFLGRRRSWRRRRFTTVAQSNGSSRRTEPLGGSYRCHGLSVWEQGWNIRPPLLVRQRVIYTQLAYVRKLRIVEA